MRLVRLAEIFRVGSSKRVLKADWKQSGVPFYRGREITRLSKTGVADNELFISESHFKDLSTNYGVPSAGDIMVTAIGTIGNTYIVKESDRFYFKDASVLWLHKQVQVDSKFIDYWLKSDLFFEQLDKGNGATVDTLTIEKLSSVKISLPSLEKQREIVEKLDSAFGEIDLLDAQQRESTKYVGTMLESCIDNLLLRNQAESVPLKNLAILENGDRGTNYPNKKMREETGIPFINAGHIGEGKLDMSQMDYIAQSTFNKLSRGKIQRNDLLFCLRGSLGKTALLSDLDEGAIASSLVIVRARDEVNPKFLLYYFLSSICKSEIEEFRSGTAQPNLGGADLMKFSVPKHSPGCMQEIVTKIDEVASQIETLIKNNDLRTIALGELRQSLLSHAFTQEEAVA